MKETLLAVAKTINATHTTVKNTAVSSSDYISQLGSESSMEFLFRGLRVVAVVFAVASICTLLTGSFKYMISSGRDDEVRKSRRQVIIGGVGTVLMIFLYYFASSWLERIVGGV